MSDPVELRVPDLGDFHDVEVIDVLVKPGDRVEAETPLITLETDKATMDVPSTMAGVVQQVAVTRGDRVSKGSLVLTLSASTAADVPPEPPASTPAVEERAPRVVAGEAGADIEVALVVLGAGPGGYTAAFRAADLGLEVLLVDRWPRLGGVCLNVGCIPSKALLHAARVLEDVESMAENGLMFGDPSIDIGLLRQWKNRIVGKLTAGLATLAKQRKVRVLRGTGRFASPTRMEVVEPDGTVRVVAFRQCIVAAGSEPASIPGLPADPRIIDSTGALELSELPGSMLVIGGGIIGLEMACVYDGLGSKVSVVELTPGLLPGCDPDLVRPLQKRISSRYERVMTGTRVAGIESLDEGLRVSFEGGNGPPPALYDRVLVAVGRVPNGRQINAAAAGIAVDARGFIPVDRQMRTAVPNIFAIGDITGQPMLAHKATHEGKVAAEVAAGQKSSFDARVIPSVAYTDPEIAWVGVTETQAREEGRKLGKGAFPWMASGRSLALNRDDGFTKLLFDPQTHRVIGGGIVGTNAGDLISEIALAIELGADAADVGLTIHPHPTLSETVAFAAEAFEGTLTDLYVPKRS